jgi:hypothetical protein
MLTWLVTWYLDHTGRRWREQVEATERIMLNADRAIGQLPGVNA